VPKEWEILHDSKGAAACTGTAVVLPFFFSHLMTCYCVPLSPLPTEAGMPKGALLQEPLKDIVQNIMSGSFRKGFEQFYNCWQKYVPGER
jgi:hypothetical protein